MQSEFCSDEIMQKNRVNPSLVIVWGYGIIIFVGMLLLLLPAASSIKGSISMIDALFTSTSAVCVTGLIVRDTEHFFTPFGKFVILILIQIGGLGYMTITTFFTVALSRRIDASMRFQTIQEFQKYSANDLKQFALKIMLFTFAVEILGAAILFFRFIKIMPNLLKAAEFAMFHSVSAFCNAGFSLFTDNLVIARNDPVIAITIAGLIIIGGFGFIALSDVNRNLFHEKRKKFAVHTTIVFLMTSVLILVPFVIFFFLERNGALSEFTILNKLVNALFHVVVPRTAGFNMISISMLKNSTLFLIIFLMFVGASPGGTGGGLKTTTFYIIIASSINKLKGKKRLTLFRRNITDDTVTNAFIIFTVSIILISIGFFTLLLTENHQPFPIIFEVVSAYGTVGLSYGLAGTPLSLSAGFTEFGKLVIIIMMLIGRIGIMTGVTVFISKGRSDTVKYPDTKILIG